MSTGVPTIDAQHKEIIEKYNELAEALKHGKRGDALRDRRTAGFSPVLYSAWHFEREEHCMEEYQCPVAAMNKQAHAEFIEMFARFYEEWWADLMDMELAQQTFRGVGIWIENHILRTDTQLRQCVKEVQ